MKNENYGYLHNLNSKVRRFESFNLPTIIESLYADEIEAYRKKQKEIQLEKNELVAELKEALDSFALKLKTEKYPYYSNEYDTILQVGREITSLDNELEKISLKVPKKKLTFDGDKFMNFLSKYTGTNISYMKNFFGTAINDLIKEMNKYYETEEINFYNYIKGTLPRYLPDLNYIENKYNANVNCFKSTGKYIQDIDKTVFKCEHPELFYYYQYAEIVGLLTEDDVYVIRADEDPRNSEDKDPYTSEEYCYAAFYKNSPNIYNEILCTNYLIEKFEKLYLQGRTGINDINDPRRIDIDDIYDMKDGLKKLHFDTKNPEEFKKIIDDYINSYLRNSLFYTDSDSTLSNNGQEYPTSGEGGRGVK